MYNIKEMTRVQRKYHLFTRVMHTAHCLGRTMYQMVESRVKTKHIVKDQNNSVHKINAK